jgi:hypothetical protein
MGRRTVGMEMTMTMNRSLTYLYTIGCYLKRRGCVFCQVEGCEADRNCSAVASLGDVDNRDINSLFMDKAPCVSTDVLCTALQLASQWSLCSNANRGW